MSTDISKIPILANPKGFPPNFVNPPSLGPALLGIIITLMIVSFGVVIMRLAANIKQHGKIGVDDCTIRTRVYCWIVLIETRLLHSGLDACIFLWN